MTTEEIVNDDIKTLDTWEKEYNRHKESHLYLRPGYNEYQRGFKAGWEAHENYSSRNRHGVREMGD